MNAENELTIVPAFEVIVDGLSDRQYAISEDLFAPELLHALRKVLLEKAAAELLHQAGIGNGAKKARNAEIRRDKINWIESDTQNPIERQFLDVIANLSAYLNQTCYTGITDWEFHYACYETGAFYRRHLDRFRTENGRKLSVITYLNLDWQPHDGGELVMYLPSGKRQVMPEFGKTVIFRSGSVEHEVLAAGRQRLSVTGWLK